LLNMQNLKKNQLTKSIALALGLAFIPAAAFATGLPGAGTVTSGSVTATGFKNNGVLGAGGGGGVGTIITGLHGTPTLTVTGSSVVQWGGPATATSVTGEAAAANSNAPGFNIGGGQTLKVTGSVAGLSLLNVDASGNTSVIAGTLTASGAHAVNIFIANANGVTVAPTGVISAPVIGFIGADLASKTLATIGGVANTIQANTAQTNFAAGTAIDIAYAAGGNINVLGGLNDNAAGVPAAATTVLLAGSTSVNVNGSINAAAMNIYGGVGGTVKSTGAYTPDMGTAATGIPTTQAYAATNVSLANASPTVVLADGNLAFSGYSALPAAGTTNTNATYGWTGVLSNTGNLTVGAAVNGNGYSKAVLAKTELYQNPWYNTPGLAGTFLQTPVGSINNTGTISSSGGTFYANRFTNTGTILVGNGNGLTVSSNNGDISLGGTVAASNSKSAISFANLATVKSGNINVSAPLTISGTGATATAGKSGTFFANATTGNVSISGALTLTSTASTSAAVLYKLMGNNISISANQTISNSTAANANVTQPDANLRLNGKSAGTVTIGAGSTLTAGDVTVAGAKANLPLVNLVADGNITATNTKDAAKFGSFTFNGNNISGAGAGTITAQLFNIDATGNIRKSVSGLSNNFWTNGLVLTSAGTNPTLNLSVTGPGRQYVNLRVAGNITVNSGDTNAPKFNAPNLQGTGAAAETNPNVMSQMMLMATKNMVLGGADTAGGYAALGVNAGTQFYFPGLTYFGNISGLTTPNTMGSGSITTTGDVNNSIAVPVNGGQGLYFMTKNLTIGGSIYTNMKSWVNFGTAAQSAQYANSEYAVSYSSAYTNTLNMAPPAGPIGNVYTIPAK
jgi:hypothetical protein